MPEIDLGVTTKNGLLYRDGKIINLPEADQVALKFGFAYAEQLVRHLQSTANSEEANHASRN